MDPAAAESKSDILLGDMLDFALRKANNKHLIDFFLGSKVDYENESVFLYFSDEITEEQIDDLHDTIGDDQDILIELEETDEEGAAWVLGMSQNRGPGATAEVTGDVDVEIEMTGKVDVNQE